jgi:uncharacterized protein with von Willebrand factor type A (vWA) domain
VAREAVGGEPIGALAGGDAVQQRVSALAAALRAQGVGVGVGELLGAHRALAAVDPASPRDAYCALRAALCSSAAAWRRFPGAWAEVFGRDRLDTGFNPFAEAGAMAPALPRSGIPGMAAQAPDAEPLVVPAAASDVELLRQKDFAAYTDAERHAVRALLARLAQRGPTRRSRRTHPTRRRGEMHDLRATIHASLRHGGELVEPRFREPGIRARPLVFVVDVSGSMAPYARMLLQYVQAAVAARRRVEAFALGTRLTRITLELAGRDPDRALHRASERVLDMGGGTRIGASLGQLNRAHGRRLGRGSVVVVLSDGWDRGEPELLAAEMARLRRSAHRLVWLNPLAADPAYEPLTRGMCAALPHTDHLLPGHSIASLEALADLMESIA